MGQNYYRHLSREIACPTSLKHRRVIGAGGSEAGLARWDLGVLSRLALGEVLVNRGKDCLNGGGSAQFRPRSRPEIDVAWGTSALSTHLG